MAIAETGDIFKALTFDGVSSRDYGVYITGEAVFNAPERDVEMITIPNRNGAFALDNGRFENITVSYPAGIFADTETDFAQAISDFRNVLCSKRGYCRLEDEYNPDEYRMAIYKSGLEVSPAQLKAGEFEIIFECKPQRWLKSGDEIIEVGMYRNEYEASGETIEVDAGANMGAQSCIVKMLPTQSGTGTPSPTNVRPIYPCTRIAELYVSPTLDAEDGTTYTEALYTTYPPGSSSAMYGGTVDFVNGYRKNTIRDLWLGYITWHKSEIPEFADKGCFYYTINKTGDAAYSVGDIEMLCSHYAFDGAARERDGQDKEYYGADKTVRYLKRESNSDMCEIYIRDDDYSDVTTFTNSLKGIFGTRGQLVYERPFYYYLWLTRNVIPLSQGTNHVWSNGSNVDLKYGNYNNAITNPTLFSSSPLLGAYGYGDISFNGNTIHIDNATMGTVLLQDEKSYNSRSPQFQVVTPTLNTGDDITVSGITAVCYEISNIGNITSVIVESADSNPHFTTTYKYSGNTITFTTKYIPFTFQKGSSYAEDSNLFIAGCTTTQGSINSIRVYCTVSAWTGTSGSTVSIKIDRSTPVGISEFGAITVGKITGNSSLSTLGNPTYIDCDIGEVYKIESDEPVSMNQYIDLGSDLPTLKSGTTTFALDDTITGVEVTPKWWKV